MEAESMIGDPGDIPMAQILTDEDLRRLGLDPGQFEILR
jgi:hypothetical protein